MNIFIVHRTGTAIGDQLVMTTVVRLLSQQKNTNVIVISTVPEFAQNNPHYYAHLNFAGLRNGQKKLLRFFLKMPFKRIRSCAFQNYHQGDRVTTEPHLHLAQFHAKGLGVDLDFDRSLRPDFIIDNKAKQSIRHISFWPKQPYALIQSEGKTTYTQNKSWPIEHVNTLVGLRSEVHWLQVGMKSDPLIPGCVDWRGKTDLTTLAVLIEDAELIVCLESLYNHLAAAVSTPAVTLFTGFLPPERFQYPTTIALTAETLPDCAYCGLLSPCPVENYPCSRDLKPHTVAESVRKIWAHRISTQ